MSGPVHVSVLIGRYLDQVLAKQDAEQGRPQTERAGEEAKKPVKQERRA